MSFEELKIAAVSLLGYEYYSGNRYAILKAEPCDPNILGLISDFVLEVDSVDICIVYTTLKFGIKFSVRSCEKAVNANELAAYLASGIGSGGGRKGKAGGFWARQFPIGSFRRRMTTGSGLRSRIAEIYIPQFTGDVANAFQECRNILQITMRRPTVIR